MSRIYLDHAASSPMMPEVIRVVTEAMEGYSGNPSSIHTEGRTARAKIEDARKKIARIFNASIGEIFFTSGGTEANNTAIKCAVRDLGVKQIVSTAIEHHAVLHSIEAMRREYDIRTDLLAVDALGRFDLGDLETLLQQASAPILVSLMHGNNEIGNINPILQIGELCEQYGAYFHTDAVQTAGHHVLNLQEIKAHFIAASAHKFNGPKGAGILFIRQGVPVRPLLDGGSQERNMRAGTEATHQILGMAYALELAMNTLARRQAHHADLKQYFIEEVFKMDAGIHLNGDPEKSLDHVLSLSFPPGPKSDLLLLQLDIAGVSASGGSACTSGAEQESHVLNAIGHPPERKTIRFSFSHSNTREEIDRVISLLRSWYSP
jgi:cysteine desulfurase